MIEKQTSAEIANPVLLNLSKEVSESFLNAFPKEISLYHKASIQRKSVNIKESIEKKVFNEISMVISFGVTGELKGYVVCECPIVSYSRNKSKYQFLQGLFVESMNILLGKILTNLEESSDLLCYLTPPKTMTTQSSNSMLMQQIESFKKNSLLIESVYDISIEDNKIPCHLEFEIKSSGKTLEV